jgi:uncharacterized membrane protein YeaQ/YmgE (transglycosylase-associated protein family)
MAVTGIVSALVVGLIVGVLGRLVIPGRQPIGIIATLLAGILAALLGTYVSKQFGVADTNGFHWAELAIQVGFAAVAVLLLTFAFSNQIKASRTRRR